MATSLRVLIAEPSAVPTDALVQALKDGGYQPEYTRVETAERFRDALAAQLWDVVLSAYDGERPFSGPAALNMLRQSGIDIPFIVVADGANAETVARALGDGAHDFIISSGIARLVPAIERQRHEASERQQRRETEAQLRSYNQRLVMLHAIDQAILNDVALETVCGYALRFIGVQMNVWGGEIMLFDIPARIARLAASYQRTPTVHPPSDTEHYPMNSFTPEHIHALANGVPYHITALKDGEAIPFCGALDGTTIHSYLSVPIMGLEGIAGTIMLLCDHPEGLNDEQREITMTVAHQLAAAIRHGHSVQQIQRSSAELEQRVFERTKALQHATHRAAAILNNTSDAIIVTDNQGRIQETNPAFREMFGYHGDTLTGFNISQMFDLDERALLEEALKAAVTFGKADNIEMTGVRADGTHFDADIAVASILEGKVLENIVYSVRDVTRRKLVELELRAALEQQRELNELKSRFVSMASHEFRTPLAIIRTTTDMLGAYRNRMDEATIDMRLDKIRAQITHLTALMDDVLTLARDQAGKSSFTPEVADFDAFCREIIDQIYADPNIGHQIDYSCVPPAIVAKFDTVLMRKAVYNLLSNAIKYSPKNSAVTVSVTQSDTLVTIRVRDEGLGIPEADQKRLFEAFHRGSNVSTISGTGLGLTIAKQAIDAHKGSLRFESRLNSGTTFIATIPLGSSVEEDS